MSSLIDLGGMNHQLGRAPRLLLALALASTVSLTGRSALAGTCGNGVLEPGEACDGDALDGFTCTSVAAGYTGGSLHCAASCLTYDVSACTAGKTITATSCAYEDIQGAIGIASDGDTVLVPPGECTLTTPLNLSGHNLTLTGSGDLATKLTFKPTSDGYGGSGIRTDAQPGKPFRITNLWIATDPTDTAPQYVVYIGGDVQNFRIDHCKFTGGYSNTDSITPEGSDYGVIDHCQFIDASQEVISMRDFSDDATSFNTPTKQLLGSKSALVVEDNYYSSSGGLHTHAITGACGSKYVFRHNESHRPVFSDVDLHGFCFDTCTSGRLFEVYDNVFDATDNGYGWAAYLRGGEGVVYNNTMTTPPGAGSYPDNGIIALYDYRIDGACPVAQNYGLPWSCNTTIESSSKCDGDPNRGLENVDPANPATWEAPDRPCKYQIHNTWIWNNNHNGNPMTVQTDPPQAVAGYILENRDYFNRAPSQAEDGFTYVPYVYPHPLTTLQTTATSTGAGGSGPTAGAAGAGPTAGSGGSPPAAGNGGSTPAAGAAGTKPTAGAAGSGATTGAAGSGATAGAGGTKSTAGAGGTKSTGGTAGAGTTAGTGGSGGVTSDATSDSDSSGCGCSVPGRSSGDRDTTPLALVAAGLAGLARTAKRRQAAGTKSR